MSVNELSYEELKALCGPRDCNLKVIERQLDVTITLRGINISCKPESKTDLVLNVLEACAETLRKQNQLTPHDVKLLCKGNDTKHEEEKVILSNTVVKKVNGEKITPKTHKQQEYIELLKNNQITFGVGPAGSGKTYLAVAYAVSLLKNKEVEKILLTRPVVEAGESLGFLPGDLKEKVDPYLRPLYDALEEILGQGEVKKLMENGTIEIAPLAYMRGRTLNNAVIILDEAQNTTEPQMKMFLTRLGFNSKMIITGDMTQVDLPKNKAVGLSLATNLLKDVDDIGIVYLGKDDVIRNPLVTKIVEAYEKHAM